MSGLKLWHDIRGHHMVEYFDVLPEDRAGVYYGTINGQPFVTQNFSKRVTKFWLCSCGDPIATYDKAAYAQWVTRNGDGSDNG